jgi:hypothetical protein
MENNIALNLREIADKVNEEAEKARVARHRDFIENEILPHLQRLAENGKYQAEFSTQGYSVYMLRDILRGIGFTVEIRKFSNSPYLLVKW